MSTSNANTSNANTGNANTGNANTGNQLSIEELKEIGEKVSLETLEFDHSQDNIALSFVGFGEDNFDKLEQNFDTILNYCIEQLKSVIPSDEIKLEEIKDSLDIPDGWKLMLANQPAQMFAGYLLFKLEGEPDDANLSTVIEKFARIPSAWLVLMNTTDDNDTLGLKADIIARHFGHNKDDKYHDTCTEALVEYRASLGSNGLEDLLRSLQLDKSN